LRIQKRENERQHKGLEDAQQITDPATDGPSLFLRECLTQLSDEERRVLESYFFQKHTLEEVASAEKFSVATASRKLQHALGNLRLIANAA
jgi:DNA-directed RNA polymerase specialized sigma24 family protein